MARRGRPPKPSALHLVQGTWRTDRHGPRPTPQVRPPELTEAELAERARDIEMRNRAIFGDPADKPEDPPPSDAELDEREAIALAQMGWKLPG